MSYTKAAEHLDKAIRAVASNPTTGLSAAKQALRACRWVRCLRVQSAALLGKALADLGRLKRSERVFLAAYRVADGCPCCLPVLDRQYSVLLTIQGRNSEAVERATAAVEAKGQPQDLPLALLYRGYAFFYASDARAAGDLSMALELFPPASPNHPLALKNLAVSLTFGEHKDLDRVEKLLPKVWEAYKGVRGRSVERADLAWLEGGVYAAKAESLRGWKRRTALGRARDALVLAHGRHVRLDLPMKAAAAWADLAAVQVTIDRFRLADLKPAAPPLFGDLAARARRWADAVEPGAQGHMWQALRELRDAADCGPPLVPYAA
jgi:hypothetical protein